MMHNEAREGLAEGYERKRNAAMTAEAEGVSERQVYKLAKQKRETGSVALRISQRGRKPKIGEEDLQRLKAEIEAHPDKTPGGEKRIETAMQRIRIKPNRPGKTGFSAEEEGDTRIRTGAAPMCRKSGVFA